METLCPNDRDILSYSESAPLPAGAGDHFACAGEKYAAATKEDAAYDTARELDQFYTLGRVARDLVQVLFDHLDPSRFQFVEPSAGGGAFLKWLPVGSIGYDIDPKCSGIIKADFLKIEMPQGCEIAVIGNPPFGKNSSMAVAFFNHAARQASVIGFVLPRTFQKTTLQNRLDLNFHLLHEQVVEKDAFLFRGKRKHVPAVFQIWVRKPQQRKKASLPRDHRDFEYVKAQHVEQAHFAIQRIGQQAGRVHCDFAKDPKSHYFIKAKVKGLKAVISALDLKALAIRTAGNPSLSKTELVEAYSNYKNSNSGQKHP